MLFVFGSSWYCGVYVGNFGQVVGPTSFSGGVRIPRNPAPCLSPSQFMFRGQLRPRRTTMLFCREAILPSVNDERSGEAVHPVGPPVGYQRASFDVPRHVPSERWMISKR